MIKNNTTTTEDYCVIYVWAWSLDGEQADPQNHANNIGLLFTVMDKIGDPPPGMTHHNLKWLW